MKKSLLFITQLIPYPPQSGGKIRAYETLKILTQKYNVTVICFYTSKKMSHNVKKLSELLSAEIYAFYSQNPNINAYEILPLVVRSFFSPHTFLNSRYYDKRIVHLLTNQLNQKHFDLIYLDSDSSFQYLKYLNTLSSTIIYDEQNVTSKLIWTGITHKHSTWNLPEKLFCLQDTIKHYLFEKKLIKQSNLIFCINNHDRKLLINKGASPKTTFYLPTPFSTQNLYQTHNTTTLIITGTMSWPPNKEGISWFCQHIYPLLKPNIKNLKLILAGNSPPPSIIEFSNRDPSITVTGEVPTMDTYYKQATISIAPIFYGSGTRIKILQALSRGIPVVSTEFAPQGLPNIKKSGIVTSSSDPQKFSKTITILTENPKRLESLSRRGIAYINNNFSASVTRKILLSHLP